MSSIADYIAKNYLSTDKKKKKKKVKKKTNVGTIIHDDDDTIKISKDDSDDKEKEHKRLLKEALRKEKEEKDKIMSKFKIANESSWVTVEEGNSNNQNNNLNVSENNRGRSRSRSRSYSPGEKGKRIYSDNESVKSRSRSRSLSRSKSRSRSRSKSPIQKRNRVYLDDEESKDNKNNKKDKAVRMSDGSLAGLQAGKDLKLDAKRKQKAQQEMLSRMTSEESGKYAKTIYRDKYGKKVDLAVEKARLAAEQRQKEAEAEKDMVWGKGLVQQREREEMVKKLKQERDRSFAVYRDDKELNEEQMEKDRWGDPMAKLIKKKSSKNKTIRPKYNGPPPPPNRFNIEPGYRWDGVDRSNGFEEKYFQMKNQKESTSEVAYKWSTEDM